MKRVVKFSALLVLAAAAWLACLLEVGGLRFSEPVAAVIPFVPLWAVCLFGCYSLAYLGYCMLTFNDCKDASDELNKQIAEAKQELGKHGIKL